jgi:sporulation protein YlmC with PRC-barrel domain
MTFRFKIVRARGLQAGIDPYRAKPMCSRAPAISKISMGIVAVMVVAVAAVVAVDPHVALSQGVELVTVDVNAVGKGYRVSKLISHNVVNDKNEKVGSLDDVVIGHDKSLFAVIQVGGFLGLGSRLVAVPWDNLKIDETGRTIELPGASKEQLQRLTEFKYVT